MTSLESRLTNENFQQKVASYEPFDWSVTQRPFVAGDVIDVLNTGWEVSVDQRGINHPGFIEGENVTYTTKLGEVIWKATDEYEAYYEGVVGEIGSRIGLPNPPVAFGMGQYQGSRTIGVITPAYGHSLTVDTAVSTLPELDQSVLDGATVLSAYVRNADWQDKPDHIVIGTTLGGSKYFFVIDNGHSFLAMGEAWKENELRNYSIGRSIWQDIVLDEGACNQYIERIARLPNSYLRDVCFRWANNLIRAGANAKAAVLRADQISKFLIESKYQLERDFENYFLGLNDGKLKYGNKT